MSAVRASDASPLEPPAFDGFVRHSCYVPASDGVLLAVDYFIPTRSGRIAPEPLPAVFQMTPYNRAQVVEGKLVHALSPYVANGREYANNLQALCLSGYVLVAADVRGQGASFGAYAGIMSREEGRDGAAVIAWLQRQPWCNGRIGMLGSSYGAATQFLVAAERPPGLQALYLCHIYFDAYDAFFPGGVRELQIPRHGARLVDDLAGRTAATVAAPVDGPEGHSLLQAAVREHRAGPTAAELFRPLYATADRSANPYFDRCADSGSVNLRTLLPQLAAAAIPAYHHGGWNDFYPQQTLRWFQSWDFAPAKLVMGPWSHSPRCFTTPRDEEDLSVRARESRRWFDHWLKDEDTGVLDEPAARYAVQTSHPYREASAAGMEPDVWEWRESASWPPADVRAVSWFLSSQPSRTIAVVNEGRLVADPVPPFEHPMDVDVSVSTGTRNRMGGSFHGAPVALPDMRAMDERCLTYTSQPLEESIEIVGAPVLEFRALVPARGLPLFVWLEDVDERGTSTLITHGIAYCGSRSETSVHVVDDGASDATAAPSAPAIDFAGAPVSFTVALEPTATRFAVGHRVRLTVSGADAGNYVGAPGGNASCRDRRCAPRARDPGRLARGNRWPNMKTRGAQRVGAQERLRGRR